MKIAIPTANGKLTMHFGHCEKFTMVDIDPENKIILGTTELDPPPHEPGVLPHWLGQQGTDLIIAGGMGQRAQQLFEAQDIAVMVGASSDTPEAIVKAYMDQALRESLYGSGSRNRQQRLRPLKKGVSNASV